MKIINTSKVEQTFQGITLKPGESTDGATVEKPKRGRPRKDSKDK